MVKPLTPEAVSILPAASIISSCLSEIADVATQHSRAAAGRHGRITDGPA